MMAVKLTEKQMRICELLSQGQSSKEIGNALGISSRTVEAHRSAIYRKLDVKNAVQLTRKFIEQEVS